MKSNAVTVLRILIGGMSHESNTFNRSHTELDDFKISRGKDILKDEAVKSLLAKGINVIPTIYAGALPSGTVSRSAYLQIRDELLRGIEGSGKIDGICLFLHGAMEVEGLGDGESDLAKNIRDIVGEEIPISASLDLHGNISPELVESTDILTAYRTAPHVDEVETRKKALTLLVTCVKKRMRPVPVMVKPPVLLPGEKVVTSIEPALSLYRELEKIDRLPGILGSSLLVGMAWADCPNAGASVIVVAKGENHKIEAYNKACELAKDYWERREEFHLEVQSGSIDEMIKKAKESPKKPVFISDSGDNPTAGAAGDIPLFLERLLSMRVSHAVVGGIVDPDAVERCREARIGGELKTEIGGKIDKVNGSPLEVRGRVVNLAPDGAVFRTDGVDVILTTRRRGWSSLDNFKSFGVDPSDRKIVVVKLGYLSQEQRNVAALALMALSPGCTNLFIEHQNYRRVRRPLYPLDRDFSWEPSPSPGTGFI